jgi:hypothetical protein
MVELKLKDLLSVEYSEPRSRGVGLDIAAWSIPLWTCGANGAGKSDQEQQHDRNPKIRQPGN